MHSIFSLIFYYNTNRIGIIYWMKYSSTSKHNRQILTDEKFDFIFKGINKVSDIDQLQLYKRIEKPNFNNEKLISISKQLELEEKSKTSFMNRKFHGNYMFNYDFNPFTEEFKNDSDILIQKKQRSTSEVSYEEEYPVEEEKQKIKPTEGSPEKSPMKNMRNIIDEIRKYQNKKVQIRENMSKPLRDMIKEKEKLSAKIIEKCTEADKSTTPNKREVLTASSSVNISQKTDQIVFPEVFDLDRVVNIKEKSYYIQNSKLISAFKFLFNPELINQSGKSILDQYYFCHNSMKDIVQKRKVLIYRDISRFSRHLMLQKQIKQEKSSFLHDSETNPILGNPGLQMILSIGAGRTKPDEMMNFLIDTQSPQRKEDDVTTSAMEEQQIFYPQNTKNYLVLCEEPSDNKIQAKQFLSMPLQESEKGYEKKLKRELQSYKKNLQEERFLLSINIHDKKLHQSIHERGNKQLQYMFYTEIGDQDKERLIRKNKISKDRFEEMRIKNLTQVLVQKRQHNKIVSNLIKSKSKSNTPNKSPRKIK